ncbi:DUF1295-domain-containing protein [Lentithecium fluviatile CBS 122367]|uniref:DUF1295-domain-containing protein n=1 Tax=Lentithecium fluviatile CBS 122367 TaxID=1168545 RepID=A0A6G1IDP6_9PLEO|nr:DUF1295-domain-containing protein [Lentithecium fluviatile CBS 122367]
MLDLRALAVALPAVKTPPECADFSKTVAPYLPQLYPLPQNIFAHINDWEALQHIYLSTNPLVTALAFALFVTPIVLLVAELNRNYSQVDRLWSVLPVIYNCHYALWAHLAGIPTQRLDHVMAVTALWGARLTFNYWRKGGYNVGSEDYRWETVKKYVGPLGMFVFDVVFISLAQNMLLFMITAPTYILLLCSRLTGDGLGAYDHFFSKAIFLLVLLEFFADQQQWDYHRAKEQYRRTAKVPKEYNFTREQLDRGFNTSGLWAWSRHPNFAAEQGVWMCLYQWCCCESWTYMNWCFVGALSYLILFQSSTWLTELLSASKYAEYKVYKQRVGKFLPKRITKSMNAPKVEVKGNAEEKTKGARDTETAGKTKRR